MQGHNRHLRYTEGCYDHVRYNCQDNTVIFLIQNAFRNHLQNDITGISFVQNASQNHLRYICTDMSDISAIQNECRDRSHVLPKYRNTIKIPEHCLEDRRLFENGIFDFFLNSDTTIYASANLRCERICKIAPSCTISSVKYL